MDSQHHTEWKDAQIRLEVHPNIPRDVTQGRAREAARAELESMGFAPDQFDFVVEVNENPDCDGYDSASVVASLR